MKKKEASTEKRTLLLKTRAGSASQLPPTLTRHLKVTASHLTLVQVWKTTLKSPWQSEGTTEHSKKSLTKVSNKKRNEWNTEDRAGHLNKIPLVLLAYSPKRDHRTLCRGSHNRYTPAVCLWSRSMSSERHHTQGRQTKTKRPEPPVSLCRACSHRCSSAHRDVGWLEQASPEHCSLCFIKENRNINMKKTYTKLVLPPD